MKSGKRTVRIVAACLLVVLFAGGGWGIIHWDKCARHLLYQRPIRYDQQPFHKTIAKADRIVVRDGGFDCCGPVDEDAVLFVITNADEIRKVAEHLQFQSKATTNSFMESCMCCGSPGIDWLAGSNRLALTSVQHTNALRWKGFSTGRILGWKVGYGDAPLTKESAAWLALWLSNHQPPDK